MRYVRTAVVVAAFAATAQEYPRNIKSEIERWSKAVKEAKIPMN